MIPAYRIRFAKTGDYRFLSHLNWRSFFERALRRTGVPLRFSEGYNPHPRIFFAGELPTGVEGLNEWALVETTGEIDGDALCVALDDEFPKPLAVHEIVRSPTRKIPPVAFSHWSVEPAELLGPEAILLLQSEDPLLAEVRRKGSFHQIDLKTYVHEASMSGTQLLLTTRHEEGRTARPRDVLAALGLDNEAVLRSRIIRDRVTLAEPTV